GITPNITHQARRGWTVWDTLRRYVPDFSCSATVISAPIVFPSRLSPVRARSPLVGCPRDSVELRDPLHDSLFFGEEPAAAPYSLGQEGTHAQLDTDARAAGCRRDRSRRGRGPDHLLQRKVLGERAGDRQGEEGPVGGARSRGETDHGRGRLHERRSQEP